jgi:hypothetical protein
VVKVKKRKRKIKRVIREPEEEPIEVKTSLMEPIDAMEMVPQAAQGQILDPKTKEWLLDWVGDGVLTAEAFQVAVARYKMGQYAELMRIGEGIKDELFDIDKFQDAPLALKDKVANTWLKMMMANDDYISRVISNGALRDLSRLFDKGESPMKFNGAKRLKSAKRGIIRDLFEKMEAEIVRDEQETEEEA